MSITVRWGVPREHISRHTGRPTGRIHYCRGFKRSPIFVGSDHFCRHTRLPPCRPHVSRHRRYAILKSHPIKFKVGF